MKDAEQRIELIKNFYIPNTKEDIFEFFILASSNVAVGGDDEEAWLTKLEQTYLKAKLTLGNGEEYLHINELYTKINKQLKRNKLFKSKFFKETLVFLTGLFLTLLGFILPYAFKMNPDASVPFYLVGLLGIPTFFAGLIMYIIPNRKKRH